MLNVDWCTELLIQVKFPSHKHFDQSIKNNITIEQKFLVKGHTQMPCDSIHSTIEKVLKNKEIYLPSDYLKLTKIARKKPNHDMNQFHGLFRF